jgi:hypothetical protein
LRGVRSSWPRSASLAVTERPAGSGSLSTEVMAVTWLMPFLLKMLR